jgi:hypothetical protein
MWTHNKAVCSSWRSCTHHAAAAHKYVVLGATAAAYCNKCGCSVRVALHCPRARKSQQQECRARIGDCFVGVGDRCVPCALWAPRPIKHTGEGRTESATVSLTAPLYILRSAAFARTVSQLVLRAACSTTAVQQQDHVRWCQGQQGKVFLEGNNLPLC